MTHAKADITSDGRYTNQAAPSPGGPNPPDRVPLQTAYPRWLYGRHPHQTIVVHDPDEEARYLSTKDWRESPAAWPPIPTAAPAEETD